MLRLAVFFLLSGASIAFKAQNDLDVIRYSRNNPVGTSRFNSMGGAFGALGADLSCSAINPAGLGLFKKGEMAIGAGLKFMHNQGVLYGNGTTVSDARFAFNNFGMALSWQSQKDIQSRHTIAFTSTQLQNFAGKTRLSAYTNNSSIAKDMLSLAGNKTPEELNGSYERMAFDVYVLDTFQGKYFSFVDLKRAVRQTRDIVTSGRINEMNFSYAYSYNDKFYFGASIGVPKLTYSSTTTHAESDDKDSMRVTLTSPDTYTTTYTDSLPGVYSDKLGFNSLSYTEYFATTGSGINFKLGVVARLNDYVRLGMHFHTPTLYTLRDVYYNSMVATFDKDKTNIIETKYPDEQGGYFDYKIITPAKAGISAAFIIKKFAAVGLEYELVDYRNAQLSSRDVSDFVGVNAVIKDKYSIGSNFKAGFEYNVKPVMLRAGYNMQGSPFGNAFTGSFVRHTISLGIGFRTKGNVFFDFSWYKNLSSEDYYMFTTIPERSRVNYNNSMLAATVGIKF